MKSVLFAIAIAASCFAFFTQEQATVEEREVSLESFDSSDYIPVEYVEFEPLYITGEKYLTNTSE